MNSTFDEPTRKRIQKIVFDLERSSTTLDEVIRSGGKNADTSFAQITSFSRDLARFSRTLDTIAISERGNIDTSVTSFAQWSRNMERVSVKLETTTESLNAVLSRIQKGEGTLGKLVQDDRLYNHMDSLSMNLNLLVKDLRENPGRYVKLSLF